MSTTIETLKRYAQTLNFKTHDMHQDYLPLQVPNKTNLGNPLMTVLVRVYDDGEMFEAMVPAFLPTELHQKSPHKLEFSFYLLHTAWNTKFGTPEVDKDGEIRFLVEIPLMDAELTLKQFERIVSVAAGTAAKIAVEGQKVLESGVLPFGEKAADEEEMNRMRALFGMMAMTNEGRAKLQEVINDTNAPDTLRGIAKRVLDMVQNATNVPDTL